MKPWVSGSSRALSPTEVRGRWLNPRPPPRDIGWHFQDNLGLLELCTILGEEWAAGAFPPAAASQAPLAGEQVGSWGSGVHSHPQLFSPHLCHNGYMNVKMFPLQHPLTFVSRKTKKEDKKRP